LYEKLEAGKEATSVGTKPAEL